METKYVLRLDGGGIKGAFTARILDSIGKIMGKPVQSKFDLIFGTSIGGLMGLKLAQLKHTETFECQSLFVNSMPNRIFDKSALDHTLGLFQWKPVYNGKGKTSVIKEVLAPGTIQQTVTPVAVTTFKLGNFEAQVLKSWDEPVIDITTAADMTSAAPVYFPPIKYNNDWYVDGGIGVNNPSMLAIVYAKKMFPNCRIKVLSIGTGSWFPKYNDNLEDWGLVEWVKHGIIDMFMGRSSQVNDLAAKLVLGDDYLRFNHRKLIDIATDDTSAGIIDTLFLYADEALDSKKQELATWLD